MAEEGVPNGIEQNGLPGAILAVDDRDSISRKLQSLAILEWAKVTQFNRRDGNQEL